MTISRSPNLSDVAIIGGGPAGAVCALALARAGVPVKLIHRRRNHPSQIDLVSGRARRVLECCLGQPLPEVAGGIEICETVSLWGTSYPVSWSTMCNPWGAGLAVNRANLDDALIRAASNAGASILSDTEVRSAQYQRGSWQLEIRQGLADRIVGTRFLVLASGRNGRNLLGRSVTKPAQLALMARVGRDAPEPRHTLYLESAKNGWWYMLPDPAGGYFAGFCTDHAVASHLKKQLRDTFVRSLCGSRLLADVLPDILLGTPVTGCPAGARTYEKVTGDGWIAVGDAAFMSNPLSGMGIDFAIESAKLGATALLAARRDPTLAEYGEAVSEYARRHERAGVFHHATARSFKTQIMQPPEGPPG